MITDAGIERYIEEHTSEGMEVLKKVERETYLRSIYPRMLSGKVQGKFLSMISQMIKPKNVLEVGTFTGYSAICLSEGLQEGGQIHTIEINEELKEQNLAYFKEAGITDKVTAYIGDAIDIIPQFGIQFDLIFIDADKVNYPKYYDLCLDKLKTGGFMVADNVLWSGKVIAENIKPSDKDTIAVTTFNEIVQNDSRVENVIVPLRDGMMLIQKK